MPKTMKPRGFAAMKPKTQKRICAMGGKACFKKHGKAHMSMIGMMGGMNSHASVK